MSGVKGVVITGFGLAGLATIALAVVSCAGLSGVLTVHQVSLGVLIPSIFCGNLPAFVVSIVGLCGGTSATVVSAVTLGCLIFEFVIGSVTACCCGCLASQSSKKSSPVFFA